MSDCQAVDPCRCPLCGGPNRCAMAPSGSAPQTPCWCTRAQFSAQLLQQVPEAARGQACICPDCVSASQIPSQTGA
ncbi:MAG: cysteine-rich CWC family protein [Betaproteobacteria bacterium]|nr:cysteine-rich CWC family protein [Betaproteobacteria bacterium]